MKNALFRDTLRRIWKTRGRFIAILAIIAIGCGFFAGVKVTSPDMKMTADLYYKNRNLMDIRLISPLGFTEDEVKQLSETDNIRDISGEYSADLFLKSNNGTNPVVRVYSYDTEGSRHYGANISQPEIKEGRMPEAPDECLIESQTPGEYQIGDTITLETNDMDNPTENILKYKTFIITGRASWVNYVDFERGTTTIGNGSVDSYLIIPKEAFAYEYYTDVYITLNSTQKMDSFSSQYENEIEREKNRLEELAEEIHSSRINDMKSELEKARTEIENAEKEYTNGMNDYKAGIADAEEAIAEAEKTIAAGETEFREGTDKYLDAVYQYSTGVAALGEKKRQLENKQYELDTARKEIEELRQIHGILADFISRYSADFSTDENAEIDAVIDSLSVLNTSEISISETARTYSMLSPEDEQKAISGTLLSQTLESLTGKISEADARISASQNEINTAASQIRNTQKSLDYTYSQLADTKNALDESEIQLETTKEELEKQKAKLDEETADTRSELEKAEAELEKGRSELEEAEIELERNTSDISWYILDRNSNTGYSSFGEDAERVDSIARVFPVFFILVAALVCFNTMTRMVEEQRTETGTLKALGYGNGIIMLQFIVYAVSASLIGAAIGLITGFNLFPKVIFNAYKMMYDYPDVICEFRWDYAAGCTAAALMCTCLSAVAACYRELSGQPAQLMRPRPPKSGKRVLLEKIPFIWNRLSFNIKVTIRNIFRYKNRVMMTVVGIGGCTALMLTGFGLRYAISAIVDLQFGGILNYDAICTFSTETGEEYENLYTGISENELLTDSLFALQKSVDASTENNSIEAFAIVPEIPEKITDFIILRDRKTHEEYTLSDEGVIINEKLAKLLDAQTGDEISFSGSSTSVKIAAVTENYSNNYIYFTPELYRNVFGEYKNNIFYINKSENASEEEISESILRNSQVMSVNFMSFAGDTFRKLVESLNAIVYVIIGSSGALAFVVLYNLSNININERMRELATIKVLGFYDGEVASYIYRENTVSSFFGMLLGLFAGVFLTRFVVQTAEVDVVMFCPDIPVHCFIFAALLTVLFTLAVNGMLYFRLKNIDMAGSMKAIE